MTEDYTRKLLWVAVAVVVSKTEVRSTVSPLIASMDEALVASWKLRIWLFPPSIGNPPLWPSPSFFSFFPNPPYFDKTFWTIWSQ